MMAETSDLQAQFERLVRLGRRLGHSPEDAEDLAQDCLAALAGGGFDGKCSLATWLYRVLWNKHVDRLRSRKSALPSPPAAEHADRLELREEREAVRAALRALPDLARAVLVFRYFEELPYDEISRILNRPTGTLKADCFRALEALHEELERKASRE